jgi:uncharacterized protein YndB with AHSA1/START domain
MELTVELPGSPEQVWDAIATANGISSWMMPTELEERQGGRVVFHMGEDLASEGTVTGWDPPRRLVYEEPGWSALAGHADAPVTPLVSEFLVEARSGGSCVLRVVTSGFGTGAEWEREFFAEVERYWTPAFDVLRLYLTHFPGQRVTSLSASAPVGGRAADVVSAMRAELGGGAVGDRVECRGHVGEVALANEMGVVVRVVEPVPGFLSFFVFDGGDEGAVAALEGHLFSEAAPAYVERERPAWDAWLAELGATVG